jgi:hypothetical protein
MQGCDKPERKAISIPQVLDHVWGESNSLANPIPSNLKRLDTYGKALVIAYLGSLPS